MKVKNFVSGVKKWIAENPVEFWILIAILAIGAFLRLYRIDEYMIFLGDEGRDVAIVRRIFTDLHPPLIGPGTSVGGMYLGPLYYYMMAIPLIIAGFSPVGPAVMVAILSVATIFFTWFAFREWFPSILQGQTLQGVYSINWGALIAAGLYAISPIVIHYSHSSWNPNIMPFFSLLTMYSLWKVWMERKFNWLIVLGISFAFVLQSHYLGLLLAPTLLLFWFLTFRKLRLIKNLKGTPSSILEIRNFMQKSFFGFLIFVVLMSPLAIFDLRHGFINTKALYKLVFEKGAAITLEIPDAISKIPEIFNLINFDLIGARVAPAAISISIFLVLGLIFLLIKEKGETKSALWFIISWLAFGILGFSFYRLPIYAHYFGFIFIPPFIITGVLFSKLLRFSVVSRVIAVLALLALIGVNISQNKFWREPNRLLRRSQLVSEKVLEEAGGKPFNLAVLAQTNYEDGYRYFMELWGGDVLHADRWSPATISDQLFVVCEYEEAKCDPTHSPKAEVANFGMTDVEDMWEVNGVFIYKLVHSEAAP